MKIVDIVLLAVIIAALCLAIRRMIADGKRGGCSGCCESCAGCNHKENGKDGEAT